jgi:phospholipase C
MLFDVNLPATRKRGDFRQMAEIKHVFVLALENRSFDHVFGFSGLEGVDAVTGRATKAEDLVDKPQVNASADGRHRFETPPDAPISIAGRDGSTGVISIL